MSGDYNFLQEMNSDDFYESFIITTAVPIILENYLLCFAFTRLSSLRNQIQSNDSQFLNATDNFERVGPERYM